MPFILNSEGIKAYGCFNRQAIEEVYMNKINKNRNLGVDILKFLCAFLVVMIHAPIPGVSQYTTPIARIAVPIFFMITGYYYSNTVKSGKEN